MTQLQLKVTGPEGQALGSNAEYQFDTNGGTLGRAESNSWTLPDPACYVSSQHALISHQENKFYLTDLSSNGTYVNDSNSAIGKNNTVCLDDVQTLTVGPFKISVNVIADTSSSTSDQATLTGIFAQQDFSSSPFKEDPFAAPVSEPFSGADSLVSEPVLDSLGQSESVDPLDLIGGGSSSTPSDFPIDWADDAAASTPSLDPSNAFGSSQSSFENNHPNHNNTNHNNVQDAFTPPQNTGGLNSLSVPDIPPENWDNTTFAAIPTPAPALSQTENNTSSAPLASTEAQGASSLNIPDDPDFFNTQPSSLPSEAPSPEPVPEAKNTSISPIAGSPDHSLQIQNNRADINSTQISKPSDSASPQVKVSQPPHVQNSNQEPPLNKGHNVQAQTEQTQEEHQTKQANSGALQMPISEATFKATGLDPNLLTNPEFIDQAVALLPYFLEGTLKILHSRAQIKNELRASKTMFQAIDNNPLKFSVNVQDAMQNLFTHRRPGFLAPNDAVKESFQDIENHETALIAGIQGGLGGLLEKIKPDTIEQRIESNESKKNLFGKITSAKKWDFYKETYSHITENSNNSFLDLFGNDFLKAYEENINQNSKRNK